ncbi:fibrillin-2-like [Liolophura sinensis]|uniref:fibrillin-2-like n=1 Tax=Liolophura sinensis TaxID=3198878 RepID=UPI00315889C5
MALCLVIVTGVVLYRRVLRPKSGSFSFSIVHEALERVRAGVRRVTRAETPGAEDKQLDRVVIQLSAEKTTLQGSAVIRAVMLLEKATQKVVQVVILALFTFATSDALVPGGNNVCTKTSTESYSQQIQGTTSCGFWGWRRCAKTTYRRGYRQRQDYECCDGWRSDDNAHCSKAICFGLTAGKCPNGGWCKSPGICSCAQGFKPPKCTDIDECDTLNGGCSDGCVNTVGSYRCSCASGYGVAKDGFNCQHIDECTSGKSDCDQRCVNTPGSFHCECISGYRLAADNTCLPVCGHSPAGTCPNGGSCVSPDNCTCPSGFQTPDCRDIDECSLSTDDCDQNCVNTLGSYRCDCAPGHGVLGDGQGSCLRGELPPSFPAICHGLTPGECPNGGSCRSPEVCHCLSGFTGNNCTDINECFNSNGGCERECHNEPGSFVCGCPSGYKLLSDGIACADINECKEKNGGCEQICDNSVGSFNCRCRKGFRLDTNNITCTDIDECSENPGFCQHDCVNIPGSFACACNSGYALQSDRKTCTDVDECVTSNGGCEQICINHVGSSECQCRAGYTSGPEQTSCTDIDECLEAIGNCSDLCVNDPGTYHCDCLAGYRLDSDGRTCQDIDECEISNGGCQELCDNSPGPGNVLAPRDWCWPRMGPRVKVGTLYTRKLSNIRLHPCEHLSASAGPTMNGKE